MENFVIDKEQWSPVRFGDVVAEPKESVKNIADSNIGHVVGLEHLDPESVHLRRSAGIEERTTFTKYFAVGDLLFGRRRAYLKKAAQASFEGICSGDITVMRAKECLLPELLPWIAQNDRFFDYAVKHSAGGLSPRVKFKDLANYEFLLPPKDQQARLAELLWVMDEVVEKELLVLDKAFNTKLSIEKNFFKLKDFEAVIDAEDFFDSVRDGTHDTPQKKNKGFKLLTSKNIVDNKLNLESDYFIDKEDYIAVNKRSKVDINDILFSIIGTVGQVCRVINEPSFAIKNMGLFKTSDEIKSLIGYYYFKSKAFQFNLSRKLSGTTQKYISLGYLRSIKLPNPKNNTILDWLKLEMEFDQISRKSQIKNIFRQISPKNPDRSGVLMPALTTTDLGMERIMRRRSGHRVRRRRYGIVDTNIRPLLHLCTAERFRSVSPPVKKAGIHKY
ncbi:MAG: restriction endonuclease subunit S [bacterium]|nr:restriction endonuclease subunit S [bacterium]